MHLVLPVRKVIQIERKGLHSSLVSDATESGVILKTKQKKPKIKTDNTLP